MSADASPPTPRRTTLEVMQEHLAEIRRHARRDLESSLVLFVGGPIDGQRMVIPECETYIRHMHEGVEVAYRSLEIMNGEQPRIRVFAFFPLSQAEVLARLIQAYPQPATP